MRMWKRNRSKESNERYRCLGRQCYNGGLIGSIGGGVSCGMMLLCLVLLCISKSAEALYEDEVGHLDYLVQSGASSSDGKFQDVLHFVDSVDNSEENGYVLTSYDDCTVTRRSLKDGKVEWRRPNVCLPFIRTSTTSSSWTSWDKHGVIQTWNIPDGQLHQLQSVPTSTSNGDDDNVISTMEWKSLLVQLKDSQLTLIRPSSDTTTATATATATWARPNMKLVQMILPDTDLDDDDDLIYVISANDNSNSAEQLTLTTLKIKTSSSSINSNNKEEEAISILVKEDKVISISTLVRLDTIVVLAAEPSNNSKKLKKGSDIRLTGISESGKELVFWTSSTNKATTIAVPSLHPLWHTLTKVSILSSPSAAADNSNGVLVQLHGHDERFPHISSFTALYQWFPSASRKLIQLSLDGENTMHLASATTTTDKQQQIHIYAEYNADQTIHLQAFQFKINDNNNDGKNNISSFIITGDDVILSNGPHESIDRLQILSSKSKSTYYLLVVTSTGTMKKLRLEQQQNNEFLCTMEWMVHDALGSITSALFLDEPTIQSTTTSTSVEEEEYAMSTLTVSHRLQQQFNSVQDTLLALLSGSEKRISTKETPPPTTTTSSLFGYRKLALMLSSSKNTLLATDTANKGKVLWELPLNSRAQYHKMIHGSWSTPTLMDHLSSHEHQNHHVLALSANIPPPYDDNNEPMVHDYICVDAHHYNNDQTAAAGQVQIIEQGQYSHNSPIVQVIPWHLHDQSHTSCRQASLILHDNNDISVLPNTPSVLKEVQSILQQSSSNMPYYVHRVDKSTGKFTTLAIVALPSDNTNDPSAIVAKATVVGETGFGNQNEQILSVTYPQRNEVVQSPSTLLGDDSLLLKYLNPHICVVVTKSTTEQETDINMSELAKALATQKMVKKPLGATPVKKNGASNNKNEPMDTPVSSLSTPNLFINIMDTVSGQILHRVSHVNYDSTSKNNDQVPVMISENWIVYAFANTKSRRTDLGVLTLHEGMIDKHGISAFSTPDQERTFSSLTSPKPVVLSKLYTVAKPVSAIGVTNTRGGITPKIFLLATGINGQVVRLDRRMLDPRRPTGDVKKSEQKEGLVQYTPLIPLAPPMTSSYWLEIPYVTSMISAAANLESQSLVLAYGGPDVFFTRMAPSKDFDSLPDNFNHPLLLLIVVGLVSTTFIIKGMGVKKSISINWS